MAFKAFIALIDLSIKAPSNSPNTNKPVDKFLCVLYTDESGRDYSYAVT
jgi:hypothetical protein